jgi:hypothetical protein
MHKLTPLLLVALLCATPLTAHAQPPVLTTQSTDGGVIARPPVTRPVTEAPGDTQGVEQQPIRDAGTLEALVRTELASEKVDYVVHPELGDSKTPELQYSGPQSAVVPQPIAEALSLLAEIAVSRARRQGLQVLQAQIQDSVCGLSVPTPKAAPPPAVKGPALLPATCAAITNSSLERLVADPETVTVAVTQDLIADAALALTRQSSATGPVLSQQEAQAILRVSLQLVARATSRGKPRFTLEDSWALASSIINSPLVKRKDALGAGLEAARIRLERGLSGGMAADLTLLVKKILAERGLTSAEDYALALDIALEADAALLASQPRGDALAPLPQERLRAGVRLTFKILGRLVEADIARLGDCSTDADTCTKSLEQLKLGLRQLELTSQLMTAAVDGSQPRMIIAGTEILRSLLGSDAETRADLRKSSILLSAIAGYAATFTSVDPSNLQAVRESRKEVLEGMIDASTDRSQRHGQWIWSVGAPVGFTSRLLQGSDWKAPQLTLPMGVAVQLMPGGKDSRPNQWGVGLHAMLTAIDLGQLLGYQPNADIPGPTWDTVVTPGAQVAATLGTPSNAFLVGLDLRYARNPLAVSTPDAVIPRELLLNVFVAYYVPFFDFN